MSEKRLLWNNPDGSVSVLAPAPGVPEEVWRKDVPQGVTVFETTVEEMPPPPAIIPQIVTMRQARLALLSAGLLAQVDAAIDALPEPQKSAARIEWDYSSEVHRSRAFVQQLGSVLGLTDEQLDDLFTQAATL